MSDPALQPAARRAQAISGATILLVVLVVAGIAGGLTGAIDPYSSRSCTADPVAGLRDLSNRVAEAARRLTPGVSTRASRPLLPPHTWRDGGRATRPGAAAPSPAPGDLLALNRLDLPPPFVA